MTSSIISVISTLRGGAVKPLRGLREEPEGMGRSNRQDEQVPVAEKGGVLDSLP